MEPQIPAIKLRAPLLAEAIRIISENEGDRKVMDRKIHELAKRTSSRSKPPTLTSATRAVTYPTLRHLGLAFGDGESIRLTAQGDALLRSLQQGKDQFSLILAAHLVKWDSLSIRILDKIRELSNRDAQVTVERLSEYYWPSERNPHALEYLERLLPYYETAKLIAISNGRIILNDRQIEASRRVTQEQPSQEEFARILLQEYYNEVRSRGSPAVSIPLLERRVCRAFGDRLWSDDFRRILVSLPRETAQYVIHFSQPMVREGRGLRVGAQYFYYIQIHRKGAP